MAQEKLSFDKETIKKILQGFLIALVPAALIFIAGQLEITETPIVELNAFIALVAPFLTYLAYRIKKGTITMEKAAWSLFISICGGGLIYLQGQSFTPNMDALIALIFPTIINAIKEYIVGETKQLTPETE